MSRRKSHLAPVPPEGAAPQTFRSTTERIELHTGGRADIDGLLRELARVAFAHGLTGFSFELDRRLGSRCHAIVATHAGFGPEQVDVGRAAINRALIALGILKVAQRAEPVPEATPAAAPAEDGAKSPTPPSSSPS